jgi:hypothetical protein
MIDEPSLTGKTPESKAHYLKMEPSDPQNFMWFYNWVLIAWIKQEPHAQSFLDWMIGHRFEEIKDMTLDFDYEAGDLSKEIVNLLRSAVVIPINGGYIFRHELPTSSEVIFVSNSDSRLASIRRMRNIDRFAKVEDKPYMSLEEMMILSDLSKSHE